MVFKSPASVVQGMEMLGKTQMSSGSAGSGAGQSGDGQEKHMTGANKWTERLGFQYISALQDTFSSDPRFLQYIQSLGMPPDFPRRTHYLASLIMMILRRLDFARCRLTSSMCVCVALELLGFIVVAVTQLQLQRRVLAHELGLCLRFVLWLLNS